MQLIILLAHRSLDRADKGSISGVFMYSKILGHNPARQMILDASVRHAAEMEAKRQPN